MRGWTVADKATGVLLILLSLVVAAVLSKTTPSADGLTQMLVRAVDAGTALSGEACATLITPDRVGRGEFERYGLAEKLQDDGFVAHERFDYIVCVHGQPRFERDSWELYADMYYVFDRWHGKLAVTYHNWEAAHGEDESSSQPTWQPAKAEAVDDSEVIKVCMDAETPIIGVGAGSLREWNIWDILSGSQCAVEMSSSICWDCGEELAWRWLIPVPAGQEGEAAPRGEAGGGRGCIDARTAAQMSGQELKRRDGSSLAGDECSVQLGGGQVCWLCGEERPEPTPSPVPAKRADGNPQCRDYLTPEVTGHEAWEKYGIADRLRSRRIQRHWEPSLDFLVCYGQRRIGEADVVGDELYYRFDIESGKLLMERIHWREDLPAHLPSLLISRQEAESRVEGKVNFSRLAFLGPDRTPIAGSKPVPHQPCWLVSSTLSGVLEVPRVTVINAITGELVGHYCPC
jgi:hypothetical protein